jgi:hypothetical protein
VLVKDGEGDVGQQRRDRSRVAGTRYRVPAPSEPYVHVVRAYGSSKP